MALGLGQGVLKIHVIQWKIDEFHNNKTRDFCPMRDTTHRINTEMRGQTLKRCAWYLKQTTGNLWERCCKGRLGRGVTLSWKVKPILQATGTY